MPIYAHIWAYLAKEEGIGDRKINLASHEYFRCDPNQHWYIRGSLFSLPQSLQPSQNEQSQSGGGFPSGSCSVSFLSYICYISYICFLQECQEASRKTPKAVLCQHKLNYLHLKHSNVMLYHHNHHHHMQWEKKEGNQLWRSVSWWVRVEAVSVEGGCSVFNGGKQFGQAGQIPALLDHHHLHLYLHLLHDHIQHLQCLLHPDWCQRMWIVYQLDFGINFCNVWLI